MNFIFYKKRIINFHFYLLLVFITNSSNSYLILPFNSTHINLKLKENINKLNSVQNLLSEINKNQLFSIVQIGNPPKNIECYLSMETTVIAILSDFCPNGSISLYNPHLSKNFKNYSDYLISIGPINNAAIVKDNCTFYNDINLTKKEYIEDFIFLLGNYSSSNNEIKDKNKFCGRIGLYKSLHPTYAYAQNFITFLKEKNFIDSYSWGLFFFDKDKSYNINNEIQNKYEGFYIVGITDKDYLNIFKTTDIISVNSIENNINFKVFFYDLLYNKTEIICSDNSLINFIVDYNYIISDKEYYEKIKHSFFQKYIDDKICIEKFSYIIYQGKINMIICDSNFKKYLNNFPTLYFNSRELSFIFNLDYNYVFLEYDDKIYFLIIYKEMVNQVWTLGKIFMKKYPFIFDQDKKTISFVYLEKFKKKVNTEIETNNYFKIFKEYFLYSLLFIGIIIGLLLGRRLWNKHRKLKANELEEHFEYVSHNKNNKIME